MDDLPREGKSARSRSQDGKAAGGKILKRRKTKRTEEAVTTVFFKPPQQFNVNNFVPFLHMLT